MPVVVASHMLTFALSAFPSQVVPTGLSSLGSSVTPVRPASPSQMSSSASSSKLPVFGVTVRLQWCKCTQMIVTENLQLAIGIVVILMMLKVSHHMERNGYQWPHSLPVEDLCQRHCRRVNGTIFLMVCIDVSISFHFIQGLLHGGSSMSKNSGPSEKVIGVSPLWNRGAALYSVSIYRLYGTVGDLHYC